uniref:Uncharacterized protein n=1 Tax=Chenopodium quinoa TaxID=63459 RepID=A0A803LC75_CHEQI
MAEEFEKLPDSQKSLEIEQIEDSFMNLEIQTSNQILYELGARKVVVLEVGPIGCLESMIKRFKPNGRCDENVNQIVINFNTELDMMLKKLSSTLEHSHFILGRANSLGYDAIINPGNHGYTYASAGCGILPKTGTGLGCLNLDGQLELFQKTIKNELTFESPTELSQYLGNSIFLIWAGSNDYLLNYISGLSPEYSPEEFSQALIDSLSEKLKILHELGAKKVVVLEVGPLGCLPVYRRPGGYDEAWCDEGKNMNATMFNDRLAPMLEDLGSTYPDSLYTLGRLYNLTNDIFKNPRYYGMSNVSHSCCVTGEILGHLACYANMRPCANPEKYLFWDGAHPTQASHNILASACFNGSDICVPNNIHQLVQAQTNTASLHSAA